MGFWAFRAARTPGISTFLYMHGPSLSGPLMPSSARAATADPDDSSVNGPFFVADLLLLFGQPNAQPSQGAPACVPTQKTLSILANKVMGSPQSLGNRNASFTPARGSAAARPARSQLRLEPPGGSSRVASTPVVSTRQSSAPGQQLERLRVHKAAPLEGSG